MSVAGRALDEADIRETLEQSLLWRFNLPVAGVDCPASGRRLPDVYLCSVTVAGQTFRARATRRDGYPRWSVTSDQILVTAETLVELAKEFLRTNGWTASGIDCGHDPLIVREVGESVECHVTLVGSSRDRMTIRFDDLEGQTTVTLEAAPS